MFEAAGYGEIATPALEYEQVLARGDAAAAEPAYKLFDEEGNVLVLRSDMTIPIARVVASRYASAAPPLRFCYFAHAYRSVRPQRGQAREMLQAGIELVGAPAPEGTVEALTMLVAGLDAAGLDGYRVGLGDARLYPALLEGSPCRRARGRSCCTSWSRATSSGSSARSGAALGATSEALLRVPQLRGGAEVLDAVAGRRASPARRVRAAGDPRGGAGDLRPRADPLARLLHGRDLRGLRRRARRAARRRRPLRRAARPLRPRLPGRAAGR